MKTTVNMETFCKRLLFISIVYGMCHLHASAQGQTCCMLPEHESVSCNANVCGDGFYRIVNGTTSCCDVTCSQRHDTTDADTDGGTNVTTTSTTTATDASTSPPSPSPTSEAIPIMYCLPCSEGCKTCTGKESCTECKGDYETRTENGTKVCIARESKQDKLNIILGASIGGVAVVVVVVVGVVCCCRRRRRKTQFDKEELGPGMMNIESGDGDGDEEELTQPNLNKSKVRLHKSGRKTKRESEPWHINEDKPSEVPDYENIPIRPRPDSIAQGHDKVLRYTRDPTFKENKKLSKDRFGSEKSELAKLPPAPPVPILPKNPTPPSPEDVYEPIEGGDLALQPPEEEYVDAGVMKPPITSPKPIAIKPGFPKVKKKPSKGRGSSAASKDECESQGKGNLKSLAAKFEKRVPEDYEDVGPPMSAEFNKQAEVERGGERGGGGRWGNKTRGNNKTTKATPGGATGRNEDKRRKTEGFLSTPSPPDSSSQVKFPSEVAEEEKRRIKKNREEQLNKKAKSLPANAHAPIAGNDNDDDEDSDPAEGYENAPEKIASRTKSLPATNVSTPPRSGNNDDDSDDDDDDPSKDYVNTEEIPLSSSSFSSHRNHNTHSAKAGGGTVNHAAHFEPEDPQEVYGNQAAIAEAEGRQPEDPEEVYGNQAAIEEAEGRQPGLGYRNTAGLADAAHHLEDYVDMGGPLDREDDEQAVYGNEVPEDPEDLYQNFSFVSKTKTKS